MALDNAKRFLGQMMKDGEMLKDIGNKDPDEVVKIARNLGFDVTADELDEALKVMRQTNRDAMQQLTPDELDNIAGGMFWEGDDAPDGHELGCFATYHHYSYQKENKIWCQHFYYGENGDLVIN